MKDKPVWVEREKEREREREERLFWMLHQDFHSLRNRRICCFVVQGAARPRQLDTYTELRKNDGS